jgi:hypothetical protein
LIVLEELDGRIKEWAGTVLGPAEITLEPPGDGRQGEGASLYLLEILSAPPFRDARPPLQVALRYLVTAWAQEPEGAHRILGRLAFAALEHPEFEFDPEPPPTAIWAAFGLAPRPGFFLRALVRRERPYTPAPVVKGPLAIGPAPWPRG